MGPRNSAIQMTILLAIVYLLMTANFEPINLAFSLIIGLGISSLVRPQHLSIQWRRLPIALAAIAGYLIYMLVDMWKSSLQVGRILLDPRLPIKPGIINIHSGSESEMAIALSAHAISLTPGELVVEMDDQGEMYAHCLDISQAEELIAEAQKVRRNFLNQIFE
jgi:multicomponent Na+:H+ antiporter subunit E